jgi:hypothetical protein
VILYITGKPRYPTGPFRCLGGGKYATPEGKERMKKIEAERKEAKKKAKLEETEEEKILEVESEVGSEVESDVVQDGNSEKNSGNESEKKEEPVKLDTLFRFGKEEDYY